MRLQGSSEIVLSRKMCGFLDNITVETCIPRPKKGDLTITIITDKQEN
jgi:hypothetical protein